MLYDVSLELTIEADSEEDAKAKFIVLIDNHNWYNNEVTAREQEE